MHHVYTLSHDRLRLCTTEVRLVTIETSIFIFHNVSMKKGSERVFFSDYIKLNYIIPVAAP